MSDNHNKNNNNSEGIELTLGLSLNGKFGVDPVKVNKLKRSCSTISSLSSGGELLARACSMPVEDEVVLRKRKELEGFGKRDVKQRIVSQRSTGSSGLSDLDNTPFIPTTHGMNKMTEAKSPQSVESFSLQNEPANRVVKPTRSVSAPNDMVNNTLSEMPCVSTKGNGPNGKRIDGFLYRYKKGEEVRIVCVCHGNFLTPAEFIKHAGGGDVEHPLRHIVVHPSPSL